MEVTPKIQEQLNQLQDKFEAINQIPIEKIRKKRKFIRFIRSQSWESELEPAA